MKKGVRISLIIFFLLILLLFFTRLLSPREIDDVSPEIFCEENYLKKADVLWVIPKFNNKSISENSEWCREILSLNKTIGLHGVYHNPYREFKYQEISKEYLEIGIKEFESCLGFKPEIFKAPQLKINSENANLIKENNLKLRNDFHQITRKVYHCNDSGRFNNKIIDIF